MIKPKAWILDENISYKSALILNRGVTCHPIKTVRDTIGNGTKDSELIPYIAKECLVLITKDRKMKSNLTEKKLLLKLNARVLFIEERKRNNMKKNEIEQLLKKNWPKIETAFAKKEECCFYQIDACGVLKDLVIR